MKYFLILLSFLIFTDNLNSSSELIDERFSVLWKKQIILEKKLNDIKERYNCIVTVTAYSPSVDETDSTPYITSSLLKVRPWTVAVSVDLYNNGWTEGKYMYLNQIGRFQILDKMDKDARKSVDIFFWTKKQAIEFGRKKNVLAALLEI